MSRGPRGHKLTTLLAGTSQQVQGEDASDDGAYVYSDNVKGVRLTRVCDHANEDVLSVPPAANWTMFLRS